MNKDSETRRIYFVNIDKKLKRNLMRLLNRKKRKELRKYTDVAEFEYGEENVLLLSSVVDSGEPSIDSVIEGLKGIYPLLGKLKGTLKDYKKIDYVIFTLQVLVESEIIRIVRFQYNMDTLLNSNITNIDELCDKADHINVRSDLGQEFNNYLGKVVT